MSGETFKLVMGTKNTSSWSLRAWLMLRRCGVLFNEEVIALRQPDTKANLQRRSPSGKIPFLEHDSRTVWDTLAIAEYLAERFPERLFWPVEISARATARSVSAEMHSGFAALRDTMPMDFTSSLSGFEPDVETGADIKRIEAIWAHCRKNYGAEGGFLFGDWSFADAMFAPVVSRFVTYGIDLSDGSRRYMDTMWQDADMRQWLADCRAEQADG